MLILFSISLSSVRVTVYDALLCQLHCAPGYLEQPLNQVACTFQDLPGSLFKDWCYIGYLPDFWHRGQLTGQGPYFC